MLPPLAFRPILKARAWGSNRLRSLGKPVSADARVGESWELADLPDSIADGQSTVAGGRFDGVRLRDLRLAHRDELLGVTTPAPDGAFPLLVKFLDAGTNLSLQVHPDESYTRRHPECPPKTEAWIILDAEPGAKVYRGLLPETTPEAFRRALAEGRALDHVVAHDVARGDCVYLPSGICHALGAGLLVAEVQTPSDVTFRVWDWDRNDPARPLHLEQSFACMRFGRAQETGVPGLVRRADAPAIASPAMTTRRLCRSPHFAVEWREAHREIELPLGPTGIPEVWIALEGSLRFRSASTDFVAPAGATVVLPAQCEEGAVTCPAGSAHLRAVCASALDRAT